MTEKVRLLPNGLIRGGSATIKINAEAGELRADGEVHAGPSDWLSIKKTFDVSSKVDPHLLKSTSLRPGATIQAGYVHLVCKTHGPKLSAVEVVVVAPQVNLKGLAYLDATGPVLKLKSAHLVGSVMGHDNLTLDVVAE